MLKVVITVALVIGFALLVVRCTTPVATLRFRMTVDVNTPDGIKSGSSVMKLVRERPFLIPMPGAGGSDRGGGLQILGEAPFVDLGGKFVFMKFHDEFYRHEIKDTVFDGLRLRARYRSEANGGDGAIFRELSRIKSQADVTPSEYPAFATFAEVTNPQSQTEILSEAFRAKLGADYSIDKVTIQVVANDEPLTTALTERFPALAGERGMLSLAPN